MIEIDSDVKLPEEKEGQEFGYIPFEQLPPAQVEVLEEILVNKVTDSKVTTQHETPIQKKIDIDLLLTNQKMKELQEQDPKESHLRKLWSQNILNKNVFTMENDILKRWLIVNGLLYKPVVTPSILKECLIMLAHDEQGHNGFKRTYSALQTVYYWKSMKRQIQLHCRWCRMCARHNMKSQEFQKEHFSVPTQLMEFKAMDLIDEFHPASSKGNRYMLTAICMLAGFAFFIPLKNKSAEEVVKAYLNHICCLFGPSRKILTDNGTEFKNKMWEKVYKRLRTEHRVTPIYSPQCNGRIEVFHKFLKATVGKQIQKGLEWDDLVWKETSAYNFFPTESSGNSPFFLMFGLEAAAKHMLLAEKYRKYIGDDQGILNLKLMQQLYHIVAYNLAKSRAARDGNRTLKRKNFRPKQLKLNGLVFVRDHTSKAFKPRVKDYHIVDLFGQNKVIVKDNYGVIMKVHRKDVQPVEMDIATAEFFRKEREKSTIRDAQHVMPIKQIPDLNWKFDENINQAETVKTVEAAEMAQEGVSTPESVQEVGEEVEVEDLQGKCLPCTPTTLESTPDTAPTEMEVQNTSTTEEEIQNTSATEEEIQSISTIEEETQGVVATNQAIQITPTVEEAIQTTPHMPQVNNFIVTKIFAILRPVTNAVSSQINNNSHF